MILCAASALVAWSCDPGEQIADAMIDASEAMMDAGTVLRDATSNDADAQAPTTIDVPCDVMRTRRVEYSDTSFIEQTNWYAELRDATLDPEAVREVLVLQCDREVFGDPAAAEACPGGATCTGEYPVARPLRCSLSNGAEVEEGLVRVQCGNRYRSGTGATVDTDSGSRATVVRIAVVR